MTTGLWDHMTAHYGSRVAKKDAPEMQLVAHALEEMGILDAEDFLRRYATTLGRTIYLPFEIGVGGELELGRQIRLCAHEHQHVIQYLEGGPKFAWEYLSDSARRGYYEADALRATMELHFWLHDEVQNTLQLAEGLANYGCSPQDIIVCAKANLMVSKVVEQGGVGSDAGKTAIEWLDSHVA
jgi:hypothetical protein